LESASYEVQVLVFAILKIVSAYCAFVKDIEDFAEAEHLTAHANSVRVRFE
jgi:histidinol dehydrogenase